MQITLFSVEEANLLLPRLRPLLGKLRAQKVQFDRLVTRSEVLAIATAGADPANPDAVELRDLVEKRRRLARRISHGLGELHELGAVVKDLDAGLCDFYALMGDRLVFLCWRADEPEVAHWHGLTEGFAGRRSVRGAELE